MPFLGEVPREPAICVRSDAGLPIVVAEPDSAIAYREVDRAFHNAMGLP